MKKGRTITILGMGPSAAERRADIAKYCAGEIWSLNNAYLTYPGLRGHFARFFELHRWDYLKDWKPAGANSNLDHFHSLDDLACPVYVSQSIPAVKQQFAYPYKRLFTHFGGVDSVYWLGSPSLMMALAIYEHDMAETEDEKIREIRSWGIDTSDARHAQQRQSWAWWTSKAQERGIKLTGTALLYQHEPDNDEGLAGIREIIREQFPAPRESSTDDFAIITASTPSYYEKMKRLKGQCESLGMEIHACELSVEEGCNETEVFMSVHPMLVHSKLKELDRPVMWIDADDEVLNRFELPTGCDVAIIDNPEQQIKWTRLHYSPMAVLYPTEKGRRLAERWVEIYQSGLFGNSHQAWNAALQSAENGTKLTDMTSMVRGCIQINPGLKRPETIIT